MLLSRASKNMSDLLRHTKAKNSEFEAIPSAGLLKNISFVVVSMQNVKCTERLAQTSTLLMFMPGGRGLRRFRLTSVSVQPLPC